MVNTSSIPRNLKLAGGNCISCSFIGCINLFKNKCLFSWRLARVTVGHIRGSIKNFMEAHIAEYTSQSGKAFSTKKSNAMYKRTKHNIKLPGQWMFMENRRVYHRTWIRTVKLTQTIQTRDIQRHGLEVYTGHSFLAITPVQLKSHPNLKSRKLYLKSRVSTKKDQGQGKKIIHYTIIKGLVSSSISWISCCLLLTDEDGDEGPTEAAVGR